jgi:hypothetical protein
MGRQTARLLTRFVAGMLIFLFLLAAVIRLDHYLLRWRAERLLSDIRSLDLRKSTYVDARNVINRWRDDTRQQGPCRTDWCDVEITLNKNVLDRMTLLWRHPTLITAYRWLGGRPAMIIASIRVRNNVVVRKGIDAYVGGDCSRGDDGQLYCTTMMAHADTGSHGRISPLHPEYGFWTPSGCEICVEATVTFTPYADPDDVRRLTDLNFACITNWRPCETQQDILPTAWKQALSERGNGAEGEHPCAPAMIRVLSREERTVPLAKVTRIVLTENGNEVTLHREGALDLRDPSPQAHDNSFITPNKAFHMGEQVLNFGRACEPVPATDENVQTAKQGAAEAAIDPPARAFLPFGNIPPPDVQVR